MNISVERSRLSTSVIFESLDAIESTSPIDPLISDALVISDTVRAIEGAARVAEYAVINIGHPDVTPMEVLAEKIRSALAAAPELVQIRDLPPRMTLVKRPTLERQRTLLGVTPEVGLDEGIARVCRGVRERLRAKGDAQPVG